MVHEVCRGNYLCLLCDCFQFSYIVKSLRGKTGWHEAHYLAAVLQLVYTAHFVFPGEAGGPCLHELLKSLWKCAVQQLLLILLFLLCMHLPDPSMLIWQRDPGGSTARC